MIRRSFHQGALAMFALVCGGAKAAQPDQAQLADGLPGYHPQQLVSGSIRLWGHGSFKADFMGQLLKAWSDGFRRFHPDARLDNQMYGTASAIGALYTGVGDIAILGEEISPAAAAAFTRVTGYAPLGIEIATGSLDVAFFDYAHMIFVHKDNPLARLTLAQADAIFGAEHRRGAQNIRRWGQLGLDGEWGERRITPYSWKDLDFSLFIQDAVMQGSHRWNSDLQEFGHARNPDGSQYDHGKRILDALAGDRYGIAISNIRYANPLVKPLAIARDAGGPWYNATPDTLVSQAYPLTRIIPAYVDRAPGQPLEPALREFLRYVLSREGQQDIVRTTGYLPLGAPALALQLRKLQ
jgi:phosphate transport system substrate-binding protein